MAPAGTSPCGESTLSTAVWAICPLSTGTFPEAKKRRVAGKAPLMPLHAMCFHALKLGKEMVWPCGEQSRNKATREEARTVYRYLETLKQAEGKRISQSTAHPEVCSERRHSGSDVA
jgi:hypothetical protein